MGWGRRLHADLISPWPKEVFIPSPFCGTPRRDALDDMNEREGFGAYRRVQPSLGYPSNCKREK